MALSIWVSEGSRIDVGGQLIAVKKVLSPTLIVLTVNDGPEMTVSDKERVELVPQVFVFAGIGGRGLGNRLAFEAPRSIRIERIKGREHVDEASHSNTADK